MSSFFKKKVITVEEDEIKRKALARQRINFLLVTVDILLFVLMVVEVISKLSNLTV